ncbi:PREDICTED: uncharacterized protein LOC104810540 [Tarenaya hassleriana]|uniref:uncharacterized protein LOC104810540 n=1 Tax=Tarenaya hassleriana TaxID=28532 RepID=UPI0008FCFA85|nr:PREDICTED: uncharacterized protein LOC104810540 [Tarenaya hassleriana]
MDPVTSMSDIHESFCRAEKMLYRLCARWGIEVSVEQSPSDAGEPTVSVESEATLVKHKAEEETLTSDSAMQIDGVEIISSLSPMVDDHAEPLADLQPDQDLESSFPMEQFLMVHDLDEVRDRQQVRSGEPISATEVTVKQSLQEMKASVTNKADVVDKGALMTFGRHIDALLEENRWKRSFCRYPWHQQNEEPTFEVDRKGRRTSRNQDVVIEMATMDNDSGDVGGCDYDLDDPGGTQRKKRKQDGNPFTENLIAYFDNGEMQELEILFPDLVVGLKKESTIALALCLEHSSFGVVPMGPKPRQAQFAHPSSSPNLFRRETLPKGSFTCSQRIGYRHRHTDPCSSPSRVSQSASCDASLPTQKLGLCRISDSKTKDQRKRGVCFQCTDKYFSGKRHRKPELQVLLVEGDDKGDVENLLPDSFVRQKSSSEVHVHASLLIETEKNIPPDKFFYNDDTHLKKVAISRFNGFGVSDGLARAELYFQLGGSTNNEKWRLASMSMDDRALMGYNWQSRLPLRVWDDFRIRVFERFGDLHSGISGCNRRDAVSRSKKFHCSGDETRRQSDVPTWRWEESKFCRSRQEYSSQPIRTVTIPMVASQWSPKPRSKDARNTPSHAQGSIAKPSSQEQSGIDRWSSFHQLTDLEKKDEHKRSMFFRCDVTFFVDHRCKHCELQVEIFSEDVKLHAPPEEAPIIVGEITELALNFIL